jgi:hypothetical protein
MSLAAYEEMWRVTDELAASIAEIAESEISKEFCRESLGRDTLTKVEREYQTTRGPIQVSAPSFEDENTLTQWQKRRGVQDDGLMPDMARLKKRAQTAIGLGVGDEDSLEEDDQAGMVGAPGSPYGSWLSSK